MDGKFVNVITCAHIKISGNFIVKIPAYGSKSATIRLILIEGSGIVARF